MGFSLTSRAPEKGDPTAENRVWGFFGDAEQSHRQNRPQTKQPRQGNRLTTTKIALGRTYWPSRDPIGENGGVNLYGMVGNDAVGRVDILGLYDLGDSCCKPEPPDCECYDEGEDEKLFSGGYAGPITYPDRDLNLPAGYWNGNQDVVFVGGNIDPLGAGGVVVGYSKAQTKSFMKRLSGYGYIVTRLLAIPKYRNCLFAALHAHDTRLAACGKLPLIEQIPCHRRSQKRRILILKNAFGTTSHLGNYEVCFRYLCSRISRILVLLLSL